MREVISLGEVRRSLRGAVVHSLTRAFPRLGAFPLREDHHPLRGAFLNRSFPTEEYFLGRSLFLPSGEPWFILSGELSRVRCVASGEVRHSLKGAFIHSLGRAFPREVDPWGSLRHSLKGAFPRGSFPVQDVSSEEHSFID
ncbi:hypothetical protein I3760_12G040700 [Carya illinoinensis]|nr:hypothetical protein I3760_12G040700 [Carya illinoinensis]